MSLLQILQGYPWPEHQASLTSRASRARELNFPSSNSSRTSMARASNFPYFKGIQGQRIKLPFFKGIQGQRINFPFFKGIHGQSIKLPLLQGYPKAKVAASLFLKVKGELLQCVLKILPGEKEMQDNPVFWCHLGTQPLSCNPWADAEGEARNLARKIFIGEAPSALWIQIPAVLHQMLERMKLVGFVEQQPFSSSSPGLKME